MKDLGFLVEGWLPPSFPAHEVLCGENVRLEPLSESAHGEQLYPLYEESGAAVWDYLPYGPFDDYLAYTKLLNYFATHQDPQMYAIVNLETEEPLGVAGYLRIDPTQGSIEVGHLAYSSKLQQTRQATEAMYLMMRRAFELGYRRYEWKCNALNEPSRRAAERLGFQFEGVFRQAMVVKGRNRDTAWFSIIDKEWPVVRSALEAWLRNENFDSNGQQLKSLKSFR